MNPEELYIRIQRLIETAPDFRQEGNATTRAWAGQAYALVSQTNDVMDITQAKLCADGISVGGPMREGRGAQLMAILYRHQALAELAAPIDVRGAFINTGAELDGLAAVARVFDTARQFIRIVDPYLDQTAVTTFAVLAAENIAVELLSDTRTVRPNLEPMARAFGNQHGATRPLSLRLAPPRALHDRLIVVDGQQVWSVTQSLKDLAAKDRLRRL